MSIVLGIDAAWTSTQPSGVALLDTSRADARCIVAAPSYGEFLSQAKGETSSPDAPTGGEAPVAELLASCEALTGQSVDIIAIDMPVSQQVITGRREADQAVSREFSSRWCSTHTPSANRPGPLGARLTQAFLDHGYPVATTETLAGTPHHLIEVYPHPALLALLQREKRVPYKVSRARRYWPAATAAQRASLILAELHAIEGALTHVLGPLPFSLPRQDQPLPVRVLKTYEDTLDAVVSAWVGWLYLQGLAVPLGDATAAVWCPGSVVRNRPS